MLRFIDLLAAIVLLLSSPLLGIVVAVCIVVDEVREKGLEKIGHETVGVLLGFVNRGVAISMSAWERG